MEKSFFMKKICTSNKKKIVIRRIFQTTFFDKKSIFRAKQSEMQQVRVASLRSAMAGLLASRAKRGIGCLATLLDSWEPQQGTFYGALPCHSKGHEDS